MHERVVQTGAGWEALGHISALADVCTSVALGGDDDGGEPGLKARIKEECHLMSELKPVISALADGWDLVFFASHRILPADIHLGRPVVHLLRSDSRVYRY